MWLHYCNVILERHSSEPAEHHNPAIPAGLSNRLAITGPTGSFTDIHPLQIVTGVMVGIRARLIIGFNDLFSQYQVPIPINRY